MTVSNKALHGAWLAVCVATAAVVWLLVGRSPAPPTAVPAPVTETSDPGDAIGEPLMLALAQAKNFHGKAKVYIFDGKIDEAIASVRQILSLQFPANAPEAEDVRMDARAVLAKLLVGQSQLDEASRVVEEGLASATRDSFFVANLHTVMGEIHRARAERIGDPKDPRAIDELRLALEEHDRSLKINMTLLKSLPK